MLQLETKVRTPSIYVNQDIPVSIYKNNDSIFRLTNPVSSIGYLTRYNIRTNPIIAPHIYKTKIYSINIEQGTALNYTSWDRASLDSGTQVFIKYNPFQDNTFLQTYILGNNQEVTFTLQIRLSKVTSYSSIKPLLENDVIQDVYIQGIGDSDKVAVSSSYLERLPKLTDLTIILSIEISSADIFPIHKLGLSITRDQPKIVKGIPITQTDIISLLNVNTVEYENRIYSKALGLDSLDLPFVYILDDDKILLFR